MMPPPRDYSEGLRHGWEDAKSAAYQIIIEAERRGDQPTSILATVKLWAAAR